jgi:hypothetical protein
MEPRPLGSGVRLRGLDRFSRRTAGSSRRSVTLVNGLAETSNASVQPKNEVDRAVLTMPRSVRSTERRRCVISREAGNDVRAWPRTHVARLPTAARSNPERWHRVA